MFVYGCTSSWIRLSSWHLRLIQAFLGCFRNIYKRYPYWCGDWEDNLFLCLNWDGYIRISSSHRTHAMRSTQISNTFVCVSHKANSPRCTYFILVASDLRPLAKNEKSCFLPGRLLPAGYWSYVQLSIPLGELLYVAHVCPCNCHWDTRKHAMWSYLSLLSRLIQVDIDSFIHQKWSQHCHATIHRHPSAGFFYKLAE